MPPRKRAEPQDETSLIPSPECCHDLIGQEAAEAELLAALKRGKLHHAWLITGQRGIGKATLAFRFARFLLRHGRDEAAIARARTLAVDPNDTIARQIANGVTQDLLVLRREWDDKAGRLKTVIDVNQVRRLPQFFSLASGGGGWRVAIIDPSDDLNRNSENALLKILEEPPRRSIILLVCNAPGRTLATIRSRCVPLALKPVEHTRLASELEAIGTRLGLAKLSPQDRARLAELSGGRVGHALDLWANGGVELADGLEQALASWPTLDRRAMQRFVAGATADKSGARFDVASDLVLRVLNLAARASVRGEGGSVAVKRMGAGADARAWAELAPELQDFFTRGSDVYLEPKAMLYEAFRRIASMSKIAA